MIPCACTDPGHERPSCPERLVVAQRAVIHGGLYDESGRYRLLNPAYAGDDATSRRFALLEVE